MKARDLISTGFLGATDAAVQIRELVGDPHSGAGGRAWAFTLSGGLSFEVLPERGLDIGAVWFAGRPMAWRSAFGNPGPTTNTTEWIGRFGGGLLVTCGLENIGVARGDLPQHGTHHDTRAHDVVVRRVVAPDGSPGVEVTGTVDSLQVFGRRVRLHRAITSFADDPAVHVADRIVNEGAWDASVALLYHINFGAPLVLPGTRIEVAAATHEIRELSDAADDWSTYPGPVDRPIEAVWVHRGLEAVDGVATARVVSPEGTVAEVSWGVAELPELVQWTFPARDSWALGIEPANAPMWGPGRDAEGSGMRVLAPGDEFTTSLTVRFA